MGCQSCKKAEQVEEERIYPEIITIGKKKVIDEFELDYIKARKLVKLLLSEDHLYSNTLNYVLFFTDEQFKNLFQGNDDYKNYPYHYIGDRNQFKSLLLKFRDKSTLLYEWYKDESKYSNLIKIWNSNYLVFELSKNSDIELKEQLKKFGITDLDDFIDEFKTILNNSIETKASDINNYLMNEYEDYFSLIETTKECKEEFEKSNINNKEVFTVNLNNIMGKLVKRCLPLVKDYLIKRYPNLNILSKIQLNNEMFSTLKDKLLNEINNNNSQSNGIGFDTVSNLFTALKNGKAISTLTAEVQSYCGQPTVAITALASSFINLAVSVKSYYDDKIENEQKNEEFTKKLNKIDENFEAHKNEIGLLDLDNYEESMRKIVSIGKKITNDKREINEVIKNMDNKQKEANDKTKEIGIKKVAGAGLATVGCIVGTIATGGVVAAIWGGAAIGNGIRLVVESVHLANWKKQAQLYQEKNERAMKKYEEMELELANLRNMYNRLIIRYIPPNIKGYSNEDKQ
jgi:hypothetical protein